MNCYKCGKEAEYHDRDNDNEPICDSCGADDTAEYIERCPHCDLWIKVN